ncbi:MAG: endonuclease, partial [Muribaculaceae bacterium]|nr:endonuclease [Muribaculaceae bacterium]
MKRLFTLPLILLCAVFTFQAAAQVPEGYYSSLKGKREGELKTAIHNLVCNFTEVSSYSDLPKYFQRTDVYPESRRWWDMYSDIPLYAPSFAGLNREHSFPKSWWGGSTSVSAYVDLNHLYPSESKANMAKSNYPLGTVDRTSSIKFDNGITTVGYPVQGQGGGAGFVFEPDDEYKGDFARTYFYMVTCYQDLTWKYTYMVNQNLFPTLNKWSAELLMKWHREDGVSQKETLRNEQVYQIQNNRNPFIDHPELAEYLWGNRVGEAFDPGAGSEPVGDPNLITPTQGMELEFGQVALGKSVTSRLFFRGENLKGSFDLVIIGTDKAQFAVPSNSIAASLVNAPDGYWLNVTYKPSELGMHEARLIVSEGGITGSRGIILRGECLEVPELTACTATAPSDITADSYVANWESPADETVDYWIVTRTRYTGGTSTQEELLAEDTSLLINEFDQSDSESYSVQSVRLGYRSPMSNVVFVDHAGISGVQTDQPFT